MGKKDKKKVRAKFRRETFERDRYRCVVCGKQWSEEESDPSLGLVNAHHITDRSLMPNGGYVKENGVTVCDGGEDSCHMRCEQWHTSGHKEVEEGLHPEDLYRKVGSSHEAAVRASERL